MLSSYVIRCLYLIKHCRSICSLQSDRDICMRPLSQVFGLGLGLEGFVLGLECPVLGLLDCMSASLDKRDN